MEAAPEEKAYEQHLKDSEGTRKKTLWSDDTKIELFEQNSKHCVWRTPGTAHHLANTIPMHHDMGFFSAAGSGRLVRTEGRMNAARSREVLEEKLLQRSATSDWSDGSPFSTTTT
ncbi:hypothetical protein LDENG_00031560 [Lucifuga dentata]|nr:hypothetical protein LDENG_00031560 [Lucifuga dentata]